MSRRNVEPTRTHAVRMSSRQFGMLRMIQSNRGHRFSLEDCGSMHQGTLGSLARPSRHYVAPTQTKDALELTPEGAEALKAFEGADFFRSVNSFHFSEFCGLRVPANYYQEPEPEPQSRRRRAR